MVDMSGVQQMRSSQSDTFNKNGTTLTLNGDSSTKVTDSSSEGDNSAIDTGDRSNHFQVEEVRFTPGILEFVDAFPGKQFSKKFTIQNIGRNPVLIRIGEPTSFVFLLKKSSRRNIFLASGASITRTVTYTYHSDDLVQKSRIPIYINGRQIDFPIVVKKAAPQLEVDPPQIDFGTINLGSEVKALILTIYNVGGTRTKFEIDVGKNNLDLVVNPMKGTVKAKEHVKVTVELLGMKEGVFYKEIWIKTNEVPIRVPILVEVVRPRLLVIYPNGTEELSAIDFPPTFVGTQRAVPFVMKNRGGETALFITVGEVNGEYQFLSQARKNHNIFNFFSLTAEEGRLEPHESRVLTALFRPEAVKKAKGWHHQEEVDKKPQMEHVVFFTMNRVHCIERKEIERACTPHYQEENHKNSRLKLKRGSSSLIEPDEAAEEDTFAEDYNLKESGFRLCLRGKSVKPEMLLQPTKLYFGEMRLRQTEQKVLTITNKSIIRVKCVVLKKMNVRVTPEEIWIGPGKIHEFSVRVTPTCAGIFHHTVKIQILGESDVVYATDKPLKVIAEYSMGISFRSVDPKKVLVPKIGPGLTPLITDEVGVNKELVTFGNAEKVPFAAKLLALNEEFKPIWMRMKSAEMDDTIIALPNDRPRGFQTWPKDKICRTIFKGWFRYAPPKDTFYTFSSEEQIAKTQNDDMWANYLLMMREIREAYNKEPTNCKDVLPSCYKKGFREYPNFEDCQKFTTLKIKKKAVGFNLQNCLVPLSPMYLSYVVVEPKMINFGLVAVNNSVSANLKINNHNVFPIAIMFIPGNSAVTVNEGTVIVHSASEKTIKVWFELGILGRYYGFLNYVINGSHEFKITISAFVIARTLVLEPKSLIFSNYPLNKAFQPKSLFLSMENWVQAPISYKMEFSIDSPYFAIPGEGEVPPKSKLLSEIVTSLNPRKPLAAELKVISESGEKELLKVGQMSRKMWVKFHTSRIDLKDIPLNLKTKVTAVVENECFHDVTFEVIDGSPMPGVTIEPKLGIIRARSFFPLNIDIQIPVAMEFSFDIHMIVQTSSEISVKVTGNVVLPNIRIKPSSIYMRKICSQSFDTVTICVENAGTTPSEVDIDFKTCPECTVIEGSSHLYLNPKQVTSVVIMFEPKDAARFVFYVPVVINNILGPPLMQEIETENVSFFISHMEKMYDIYGEVRDTLKSCEKVPLATLSCTVASSLITVTPKSIVFHQRQVTKSVSKENLDMVNDNDYNGHLYFTTKTLVISNDGTKDVTFCLRNDDLGKSNDSPFDLVPVHPESVEYRLKSMKATLKPGEQLNFTATFSPKKPGQYSIQIPVYVRGYNDGVVYCYISLSGELNSPKLIPEADEIHFHPAPLNVSSEFTFTITAENYYKTDTISCLICESKEKESDATQSLTTRWLETPEVTELNGRQKFAIKISFKSIMPVALRCYLVFVDSGGNYCSVLLTAIADNSSVTLHTLLNFYTSRYKIVRHNCSPLIWKADEHPVLSYPFDKAHLYKTEKPEWKNNDTESGSFPNQYLLAIDRGPCLVVQGALSTLNVGLMARKKECEESTTALLHANQVTSKATSLLSTVKSFYSKVNFNKMEVTYPNYPSQEDLYKKYCDNTLQYVERWIFEVVMRCSQYFMIPSSFKIFKKHFESETKTKSRKQKDVIHFLSEIYEEDLVQRLENINDDECPILWATRLYGFYDKILQELESRGCFLPHVRAEYLLPYDDYRFFVQNVNNSDILRPIDEEPRMNMSVKFSLTPLHQKTRSEAEALKTNSNVSNKDWFSAKSVFETFSSPSDTDPNFEKEDDGDVNEKATAESHLKHAEVTPDVEVEFQHTYELLEETEFNRRSTQAWLDIIVQVFRHSVLKKIVYKSTIPEVQVVEPGEKIPVEKMETNQVSLYGGGKEVMVDMCTSNLYNVQERMLLLWLNHHLNVQRKQMWRNTISDNQIPTDKVINNFQNDLCDSLALISVTASYCPYVISEYFRDCIPEPNTPNKIYHNAARLVQAWRELSIGLTVETTDIVQPNNIFMVMLVAQLYEVLPALHPRYLISYEASLSSHQLKKFSVQTDLEKLVIQPKLLGEDSKYFVLNQTSLLEVKQEKVQDIKVTFFARKIKKMKATLLLTGCEESPYFGKGLAFFLEGQLTELMESRKMNFSAPLYKVICTEIPIKPPYPESATYEVWYSTVKPALSETSDLITVTKPWSKISFRKVCRRLFLNKSEVSFDSEEKNMFLNVTVACFTRKERFFWLLFRSKTGDFIVRIKIKPKTEKKPSMTTTCWYPETWPSCSCPKMDKEPRINWADMKSCPLITAIRLPSRNVDLWNALKTMFLKCVLPQEKIFWTQYFEKDIGLCIIRWLLSPDEEEEVVDEFVPLLQTSIKYSLTAIDSKKHLKMPPQIEIKDVRQEEDFIIPVHVAEGAKNQMEVEMTSESEMEVRRFIVQVNSLQQTNDEEEDEDTLILSGTCQPCTTTYPRNTPSKIFKKSKKFAKLY